MSLLIGWVSIAVQAQPLARDASTDDTFRKQAEQHSVGPAVGPRANMTSFAPALRCMDSVFRTYGAKDVSVIVEDIPDATSKVKVGAKDMFISATSQMTRGTRAIRLIPWDKGAIYSGRDDILKGATFAIQGSISQFDETMLRKQREGAVCLGPICLGAADSDSFSGMSLDLNVVETQGLSVLPGVSSKNFVLIRRKGRGFDGDISYKKFGAQYNFTFTSSDGQGQALRSLVELSVIELYGRLLKIPYWGCLGLTDADPGVAQEIEDWWEALRGDVPSLLAYYQIQMSARGLYKGEIDGQVNDELKRAVRAYKVALGGADDVNLDLAFFKRYLSADHAKVQLVAMSRLKELLAQDSMDGMAAKALRPYAGLSVAVASRKGLGAVYAKGEEIEFEAGVNKSAFMYCFLIDEQSQVTQFFPNPAQPSAAVAAGRQVNFPGAMGFRITASNSGTPETIACLASAIDLGSVALGKPIVARDVGALKQAFSFRAGQVTEAGVFHVKVQ